MPRALILVVTVLSFTSAGCSSQVSSKGTTSERQRDSVLGASKLPGARGVRGAMAAQDSAAARNARLDSVASQP